MVAWAATPYGAWALFFIAVAESSVFQIPPDLLLVALGVANPERAIWFRAVCTVGSVLGGMLGYLIGLVGGRPVLYRLFKQAYVATFLEKYFDVAALAVAVVALLGFWAVDWLSKMHAAPAGGGS